MDPLDDIINRNQETDFGRKGKKLAGALRGQGLWDIADEVERILREFEKQLQEQGGQDGPASPGT